MNALILAGILLWGSIDGDAAVPGPVTDLELRPEPGLDAPAYLEPFEDLEFGTRVVRVTGDPGTEIAGISGSYWGEVARHHYSKDAAWNADESLIYLQRHTGKPVLLFLDGVDYRVLFGRDRLPGKEARWHPDHVDQMVFVREDMLGLWDVRADTTSVLRRFEGYSDLTLGPWEGNISRDGGRLALSGTRDDQPWALVYDLGRQRILTELPLTGIEVDWVSISASGTYVVINGRFDGEKGDQTRIYDLEGNPIGELWAEYGRPSHYDLTLDVDGEDIAVGVSKSAPDNGRVIKRRLRDGMVTVLTPGGYASHTSARNLDRPGWVYVSYQYAGPNWPPFHDELVAVSLDGSLRVERLAHLRAHRSDYLSEAHAVPSPSGSRVLWAANWGAESGRPIATYVVELPWLYRRSPWR